MRTLTAWAELAAKRRSSLCHAARKWPCSSYTASASSVSEVTSYISKRLDPAVNKSL
jgi:hypothetical protein